MILLHPHLQSCKAPRVLREMKMICADFRSADDEMTIKCAYRRNCCIMDNDNYQDKSQIETQMAANQSIVSLAKPSSTYSAFSWHIRVFKKTAMVRSLELGCQVIQTCQDFPWHKSKLPLASAGHLVHGRAVKCFRQADIDRCRSGCKTV